MKNPSPFRLFAGTGSGLSQRGLTLPPLTRESSLDDPRLYVAEPALRDAVNVALALGQPLLLSGEPGTGKTQLAGCVAHELELPPPLVFSVKTTSTARDLFYRYDALQHFHAVQIKGEESDAARFIRYEALGMAILLAMPPAEADPHLPVSLRGRGPVRSVVLLDEIDKAPRDLPNDILDEIENMQFEVPEIRRKFSAATEFRPIVVLTSNSEKHLPDAFLRRCVYYHIEFPDEERLREIVERRLGTRSTLTAGRLQAAIEHFTELRSLDLVKPPATAEFLAWMKLLDRLDVDLIRPEARDLDLLAVSYSALAKTRADLQQLLSRASDGTAAQGDDDAE